MTDRINDKENTNSNLPDQPPPLTLSFLLSREEYAAFSAALWRQRRQTGRIACAAIGLLAFCAGLYALFFTAVSPATASCVVLIGLFCLLYDPLAAPLFCAAAAAGEYEITRSLHTAKRYTVSAHTVRLEEGESFLELPLDRLTRVYRTEKGPVLSFDEEYWFMIPARALGPGEAERLYALPAGQQRQKG